MVGNTTYATTFVPGMSNLGGPSSVVAGAAKEHIGLGPGSARSECSKCTRCGRPPRSPSIETPTLHHPDIPPGRLIDSTRGLASLDWNDLRKHAPKHQHQAKHLRATCHAPLLVNHSHEPGESPRPTTGAVPSGPNTQRSFKTETVPSHAIVPFADSLSPVSRNTLKGKSPSQTPSRSSMPMPCSGSSP